MGNHMNQIVLQQLKNFGYHYHALDKEQFHGFHCHNPLSQGEFFMLILPIQELLKKGVSTFESFQQSIAQYVVLVIEVDHHLEEMAELLSELIEKPNLTYLLFDPEEDIEFFLKDLWNVLVLVHQAKLCKN